MATNKARRIIPIGISNTDMTTHGNAGLFPFDVTATHVDRVDWTASGKIFNITAMNSSGYNPSSLTTGLTTNSQSWPNDSDNYSISLVKFGVHYFDLTSPDSVWKTHLSMDGNLIGNFYPFSPTTGTPVIGTVDITSNKTWSNDALANHTGFEIDTIVNVSANSVGICAIWVDCTWDDNYTVSATPNSGPLTGGNTIQITGRNIQSATSVAFIDPGSTTVHTATPSTVDANTISVIVPDMSDGSGAGIGAFAITWAGPFGDTYATGDVGSGFSLPYTYVGAMTWQVTTPLGVLSKISVGQPTAFVLPFDVFSNGVLYPKGTLYTWVLAAIEPTDTGWWLSIDESFAGAAYTVNQSRPKDPRGFTEIASFATGSTGMMGGFPGPSCVWKNHMVYAEGVYTPATTSPVIRIFDGEFDRPVTTLPNTSAGVVPIAVMSMLTANGQIYLSTYDTGTSSADFIGRVFSLDIESGEITPVGAPFPTGHIPYALAWHAGRLWCGTHRQDTTAVGKIFYFRPGIDTAWTDDYTLSSSGVKSCTSLLSYMGKLYVGTTNAAGNFAKVIVRSELGAYTTSDTGSGGTAAANNAYLALVEFDGNLYASFWNPDGTVVSKVRKFDNTTWTTAYSGSGSTLVPYVGFPTDGGTLLTIGGGVGYSAVLLSTTDGTTWADRSAFLSQGTPASTGIPVFGMVMH